MPKRITYLILLLILITSPVFAKIEISDFFSDFTSSDASITSDQNFKGYAVFELLYEGKTIESHKIQIHLNQSETISKVIIWKTKPEHDYYTAKINIYDEKNKLLTSDSYQVSYGTVSLPSFHVIDLSPSNSGVQLLLRPFNPTVIDIKIELIDGNDIIYTETEKDVSLVMNKELKILWPFLLENNKKYNIRVKIFTHRLNAEPLINTYLGSFIATKDVEILRKDVEVDEFGASVTIRGKSQVPFDGYILVKAVNKNTNKTKIYKQQIQEILTDYKEDTAGVVWGNLKPGIYDIVIEAVDTTNIVLDKYETVLRIPEISATVIETPQEKSTPGFTSLSLLIILILFSIKHRKFR